MRIRRHQDGSYWIPRENKQIEGELDLQMNRVLGSLRWFPKYNSRNLQEIYDLIAGKEVNIVGKGPSLDLLTAEDFGNRPTFALNEAIHTAERLNDPEITFGIVQDGSLKSTCLPKRAGLLVNARVMPWYAGYPRMWVFQLQDFGLEVTALSALVAVRIATLGGASSLRMLAFDAAMTQDLHYAPSVGYQPNLFGRPARFLTHREDIEKASTLPIKWSPALLSSGGKAQQ